VFRPSRTSLIDRGFGQFSPRFVENRQRERHAISQQLGIDAWDDNEIMAIPMDFCSHAPRRQTGGLALFNAPGSPRAARP
jgi:hypothetical protein